MRCVQRMIPRKASYNNHNILSFCSSSEVWNVGDWAHHQVSLLFVLSQRSWNFNSVGSKGLSQKLPSFETSTSLDKTLPKTVGVQSWPPLKLQQLVEMSTKTVRVQSCRAGPPWWRRPPLGYAQGGGYSHIRTFLFPFQQDGVLWELNMYITNFSKIEPLAEVGCQLVNRLNCQNCQQAVPQLTSKVKHRKNCECCPVGWVEKNKNEICL